MRSEEQAGWLDDLQPLATSTDNAMRSRAARVTADVSTLLPDVAMPTLVVHARGDRMMEFSSRLANSPRASHMPGS